MAAKFPLINGKLHSWASAEIDVSGEPFYGITALNFSSELEQEGEYASSPIALGRVIKQYKASCDMEMILSEWDRLIAKLGDSYMEQPFNVGAQWIETAGQPTSNVAIIGATITKDEQSNATGVAKVKATLFVFMPILRNGLAGFRPAQLAGGVGSIVSSVQAQARASFGF